MTLGELLNLWRIELDDVAEPYLWSDTEAISYAVDAEREACRRARLLVDASTVAVCQIALVANTALYALDSRVIRVNRVRLTGDASPLTPMMVRDLDQQWPGWEDDTGTPQVWCPDYESSKLRFVGNPTASGTANLQVVRLPLTDVNDPDDTFEIPAVYHANLRHWMAHRAWLKRDSETYNEQNAAAALAMFEREFGPPRPAYDEQWMTQYYAGDFNGRY